MSMDEWQTLETVRCETGRLLWGLYRRMRPGVGSPRPK
jgi:hypothetical protein